MPDPIFSHPRLAAVYDDCDPDRGDLELYLSLAEEVGARSALDVGCGTGTLACLLADRGLAVTGVDPALASLDVARSKPGADRIRWLHGDATTLPPLTVDLATMTGNVAQVFVDDASWAATLAGVRRALAAGGTFVFETRDPERRAWERWTPAHTRRRVEIDGVGGIDTWTELTGVSLPTVSFRHVFHFRRDDTTLISESTLRFRARDEVETSLSAAGFVVREVRDAPDRPGLELVFVTSPA